MGQGAKGGAGSVKYPFIFYVDSLPNNRHGQTQGPFVRILKSNRDDVGLREHELVHVKQWFLTLGLHSALYLVSKRYRLWSEVQAYRKQLEYSPGRELKFAIFIVERYKLNISVDEVLKRLQR